MNRCPALPFRHMMLVLVAAFVVAMAGRAGGQEAAPVPTVDWLHGRDTFELVSRWVEAGQVPEAKDVRPIVAKDVLGVRVTVRWLGLPMASGDAYAPLEATQTDIAQLARESTAQAVASLREGLEQRMANQPAAAQPGAGQGPVARSIQYTDLAKQLTVSMQIAHGAERVLVDAGAPENAVYQHFAPGYHGLRGFTAGMAPKDMAWVWPASALAFNVDPGAQVTGLVVDMGFESDAVKILGRTGGPLIERFKVIHIARSSPSYLGNRSPEEIERGDPVNVASTTATLLVRGKAELPTTALTTDQTRELAERTAGFLARKVAADGVMSGTYLPSDDFFEPRHASIVDSSLAALAMVRWVNAARQFNSYPDTLTGEQELVQNAASRIIRLNTPSLMKVDHKDWTGAALSLLTMIDSPAMADLKSWRDTLTVHLRKLRNRDGTYRAVFNERAETLPLSEQVVIHSALVAVYERTKDSELGAEVLLSHQKLWTLLDPEKAVSALPWLLDAEMRMRLTPIGMSWRADGTQAKRDQQIASLVKAIEDRQITRAPRVGPADVVGGYEFRTLPPGTPPHVDWTSAYPIAMSAALLRVDGVTPADKLIDRLLTAGLGARFIASLSFAESDCYYVRSKRDAIGGSRMAMWDNRVAVGPTAMNLLALDELLASLVYLKTR
jgi:hypothetical protein